MQYRYAEYLGQPLRLQPLPLGVLGSSVQRRAGQCAHLGQAGYVEGASLCCPLIRHKTRVTGRFQPNLLSAQCKLEVQPQFDESVRLYLGDIAFKSVVELMQAKPTRQRQLGGPAWTTPTAGR